ncbi:hypothetical protein SAMN02799626_04250 [Caulobacter sp. UNC279MFTsu5.1]|nr:hypothetical protein SAMN02799626_04250 [Caulobacter sp. UNC279MFTsu5.1]
MTDMTRAGPVANRSVVERRAPRLVEQDDDHTALMRALEFYPTPLWAARACGEVVRRFDRRARRVWEPACGEGHMASALAERFRVQASDVHPYGYGQVQDFFSPAALELNPYDAALKPTDWIITNPPFALAQAFAEIGLRRVRRGVALLCRLPFEESVGRHDLMRRLSVKATFCERVGMQLGSWDPELSTATAYALFVWMTPAAEASSSFGGLIAANRAAGGWLSILIPPGTKDRLTRPDDAERFGGRRAA